MVTQIGKHDTHTQFVDQRHMRIAQQAHCAVKGVVVSLGVHDRGRVIDFECFAQAQRFGQTVDGIIIGGSLGESSTLSHEERLNLTKAALKAVGQEVDVLLNIAEGEIKIF